MLIFVHVEKEAQHGIHGMALMGQPGAMNALRWDRIWIAWVGIHRHGIYAQESLSSIVSEKRM